MGWDFRTWQAVTHLDDVFALGLQRKVLIEGGDAVYLGHADIQLFGDPLQNLRAEIFVLRLDVLHDGDQVVALAAVGVNDLIHTVHRNASGHGKTPPRSEIPDEIRAHFST